MIALRDDPFRQPTVLHVRVATGNGGGPDKTIVNSPRYLRERGYRVLCAFMHAPDDHNIHGLRERAREAAADFISVPDCGPLDHRVLRRLLSLCRDNGVHIWHGHDYKSNLFGLLLRRHWPMHLVTTVHGWGVQGRRTRVYYAIDRMCLKFYDRVICVSEDLYESCLRLGVSASRCTLVPNAIDTGLWRRTQSMREARQRLGLNADRLLVGGAGHLSDEKGFHLLIPVVDALVQKGIAADLVIAGEGHLRHRLQAMIEERHREHEIRLLGYQRDMRQLYEALDVFVLSSLREGLPNVLLEAMAMGVPVVATSVGGVAQVVQHGRNGWLIPADQPAALEDALGDALGDGDRRAELGRRGRETVEQRFSFANRMERIRHVYDSELSTRSAPAAARRWQVARRLLLGPLEGPLPVGPGAPHPSI